jgi:hypothetical protein
MAPDAGADDESANGPEEQEISSDEDWIPGQDVQVNHKEILEILTTNLDSPLGNPPQPTPRRPTNAVQRRIVFWNRYDGLLSCSTFAQKRSYHLLLKFSHICYQPWLVG